MEEVKCLMITHHERYRRHSRTATTVGVAIPRGTHTIQIAVLTKPVAGTEVECFISALVR
jgi:hypothetical protein